MMIPTFRFNQFHSKPFHSNTFHSNTWGAFLPVMGKEWVRERGQWPATVEWGQGSSLGGPVAVPSLLGTAVPDRKDLILFVKKKFEK